MSNGHTFTNYIGHKFNNFSVISYEGQNHGWRHIWKCRCVCGNIRILNTTEIRTKKRGSCGCISRKRTHGLSSTLEYKTWQMMLQRCTNPSDKAFKNYGARGITVCDRWRTFHNFITDMGMKPKGRYSIDRVDNNGNYTPDNCIWATDYQQANNKRDVRKFIIEGEELSMPEISRKYGINVKTLRFRLLKKKMSVIDAVYTPVR